MRKANNKELEQLKVFIADRIQQRRADIEAVYGSEEEQAAQLEELRKLEVSARAQSSIFNYAKWYAGCNEIIVLENILWEVKELEKQGEYEKNSKDR